MKSHIKYIGVIDNSNKVHFVKFDKGVNIITGKSSTGKSAMIEIFDYCFGSSDFTVPSGIITDNTQLYFVVLSIKETNLVIARSPNRTKAFLKEETILPTINNLSIEYFEKNFFITLSDFKRELGRYFGIDIEDTDIDLEDRKYRKNNKAKGRPSIRHMTSFMLQHQNLIANKHSIFYRFDEKEKREQTIEQFKIFTGFVTQEYFLIKQKLAEEERTLKRLENQQKVTDEEEELSIETLNSLLKEYVAVTGNSLFDEDAEVLVRNPANTLERLVNKEVLSDYDSDEALKQLQQLNYTKNKLYAEKRTLLVSLNDINVSIEYAKGYREHLDSLSEIEDANIHLSECPFCNTSNEKIVEEANELGEAIYWLNEELAKTPYMLDSFEVERKDIEEKLKVISVNGLKLYKEIRNIKNITKKLGSNKSLEEQGLKIKLKVENLLEMILNNNLSNLDSQILASSNEITRLKNLLKEEFNVNKQIKDAETYINKAMKQIGEEFEFEDSYKPINLKFSLDSFELWHVNALGEKVYLRSMGSGANWLYSHLTLFMALHKYFCSLGSKSLVPPILFLDQPSQVYFPISIKDSDDNFDAKKLKEKKGDIKSVDEDLEAVTNLFNQMVKFCKETLDETGIEPQIIITDHADNLTLDGDIEFEDLVNGRRWRTRGFIEI